MTILPCIICGTELEPAFRDLDHNQPHGGTTFTTRGHYGSTVFDPPLSMGSDRFLELNICDPCLLERKDKIIFVQYIPTPSRREAEFWDPESS